MAGAALLGVGIAHRLNYDDITDLIPEQYNVDFAPTAVIVVGAIIFVIAFFGCCGAIKESRFLLLTVSNKWEWMKIIDKIQNKYKKVITFNKMLLRLLLEINYIHVTWMQVAEQLHQPNIMNKKKCLPWRVIF